jgi:hypothetical protein
MLENKNYSFTGRNRHWFGCIKDIENKLKGQLVCFYLQEDNSLVGSFKLSEIITIGKLEEDKVVLLPEYFGKLIHIGSIDVTGKLERMKEGLEYLAELNKEIPYDILRNILRLNYSMEVSPKLTYNPEGWVSNSFVFAHPYEEVITNFRELGLM